MSMKGFVSLTLITLAIVVLSIFGGYSWYNKNASAVSATENFQSFVVPKGRSAAQVGAMLEEKGLIKNSLAFKIYVQVFGKSDSINAGEFRLSPSMSVSEIVDALGGGAMELWVTIPEGLRKEEMIEKITTGLEMDSATSKVFEDEFLTLSSGKEGYLFPDTYLFPREASASSVLKKLEGTFESKVTIGLAEEIEESDYSLNQIIIMASIIERETITDTERPVVAGILWKRLESDWPLQVDASVQYGVANVSCRNLGSDCVDWWPILTLVNLETDSPFNTYMHPGLPPAPIANPGLSAITASANPVDSDYWYYIHDPEGVIHYAESLQGHNENIRAYLGK